MLAVMPVKSGLRSYGGLHINPYDYWSDLIDFIGCEGIDLNSFVHSQWHKHTKAA